MKRPLASVMIVLMILQAYLYLQPTQPASASPAYNIVLNGDFSDGLSGWNEIMSQGDYTVDVISQRLCISLKNDSSANVTLGQAWRVDEGGQPIESDYTVQDNNHLSLDILLDIIEREHSTMYATGLSLILSGTPWTTISYIFNGTDGLSNPLGSMVTNSSLTGSYYFFIQVQNQTWHSLDRNVVDDLAAVAPMLDPAHTKYIAVALGSMLDPPSAAPTPHDDYLRTWFDNLVIGGAYSVKVYDVAGATVTLNSFSLTVTGDFVQFVNVPYGAHTISTTSTVTSGDTRYVFLKWAVSGSPGYWLGQPLSITIAGDMEITVERTTQFRVAIQSSPPSNVNIYVDGSSIPAAQTPCNLWFDKDTSHSLKAEPEIIGLTGYVFDKWQGGIIDTPLNPITIIMDAPYTLTALYAVMAPNFRLLGSPSTQTVSQGSSATFTIEVKSIAGFSEVVTLSVPYVPSGLTITFAPTSGTPPFTGTMLVATTSTISTGDHLISIAGTSDTKQQGASVTLTVTGRDFSISISPTSQSVYKSLTATFTISVNAIGDFSDTVTLSLSGGLSAWLSVSSGIPPFSSTLTVSTTDATTIGTYTFTITGTGWGKSHSAGAVLLVEEYPPDYVVTVKTSGLPSGYSARIHIDEEESEYVVYDGYPETLTFKALTSHNVTVDYLVSDTDVRYRCSSNKVIVTEKTTLTFTFSPEYRVVFTPKAPSGETLTITVAGVGYRDETPFELEVWLAKDVSMSFSISPINLPDVNGKKYAFLEWKDGTGKVVKSPLKVTGPLALTAHYIVTGLTLTVYDLPGATITLNSVSKTVAEGQTHVVFDVTNGVFSLSTTEHLDVVADKSRVAFLYWKIPKDTGSEMRTLTTEVTISDESVVAEVKRVKQYYVVVSSALGDPRGTGWYGANTTITISVTSPVDYGNNTRHLFTRWAGDHVGTTASTTVFLDSPKTISAEWRLQYKLAVSSRFGTVTGDGWHDKDATATFSATPPSEDGTQYIFISWSGDFSGSERTGRIEMDRPRSVSANWRRLYSISLTFVDSKDVVLRELPLSVVLTSPNGSATSLMQYSNVWLDEGTWVLKQVNWHGVDVKKSELSYHPRPRDTWRISTRVCSLTIKVTSSLTGGGVSGASVSVSLPDGAIMTDITDSDGNAIFAQLPPSALEITIQKEGATSRRAIQLASDYQESVSVLPTSEVITYVVLPIIAVVTLIAAVMVYMRRRRGSSLQLPTSTPAPALLEARSSSDIVGAPVGEQPASSLATWMGEEFKKRPE